VFDNSAEELREPVTEISPGTLLMGILFCSIGFARILPSIPGLPAGACRLIFLENSRRDRQERQFTGAVARRGREWMFRSKLESLFADPYGAPALMRRLLAEQGILYSRRYAITFALMGVTAASTALSAYLIGQLINQAYVQRNFPGVVTLEQPIGLTANPQEPSIRLRFAWC
jgi:hypothetical protein